MVDGTGPWGKHLLVDCKNYSRRWTKEHIARFIDGLIFLLKMKKLGPLVIDEMDEENNKGISAIQMITTSSITFHEDAIRKSFYLDVFSCSDFDAENVIDMIKAWFDPQDIKWQVIERN